MKNKGLLIALIVLAVLGGAVYWSEKKKAEDEKHPPVSADAPPKILTIPEDQIQSIRIERRGETTVLSRASGRWELTEPKALPADQDAATAVAQNVAALSSERLIEEKPAKLDVYGLANPASQVTVTRKDGKKDTLQLGDELPAGASGVYAKLTGDPRVFAIASYVKSGLDKTVKDLRDKRLLHFDSEKLARVEVAAKSGSFEFGKNGQNEWQIVKPAAQRADGQLVDELVRKLKEAKMDPNVTEEDAVKAQKAFQGGTKVATVTASATGAAETLELRKTKDGDTYAKSSTVEGVYKMPADLAASLDKPVDDFRNKKLFDFGYTDPTQVSAGSQVLVKSGEKWLSGGGTVDSASVQALIDKLRDLTATGFPNKAAGQPYLALSATSNGGKRVERVSILKQNDQTFATREGEPAAYVLDAKSVQEIEKAAAAVKPAAAAKPASKK